MGNRSKSWEGLALGNGRYRITAMLGEGGMGSVYRALDRNLDADVVVKVPRQAMMEDPEFAGRFTREVRSLVKLSHPHIVKVTDVGEWEGMPFAVMQFLAGGSLEDRRPAGPGGQPVASEPREVPRWLTPVAEALDYVHGQGYVHRDVKPGNILFDAQGYAFLSDFGVAKVMASSGSSGMPASHTAMTGTGMVLGTPEYMAPELIMGEPFDGRVDQYALAVTVYELLCGRRPFEDTAKTKVLVLHSTQAPPGLTQWCPTVPERLSQVVLKGLAKDPKQRYVNCAAMAAAIAAAVPEVGPRDDRVRIKCPACGKKSAMAARDYARVQESGRRIACPACQAPLDLSGSAQGTGPAAPGSGSGSGGTMWIARPVGSGAYDLASDPRPPAGGTTAHSSLGGANADSAPMAPPAARGGTMAMTDLAGHRRPTPGSGSRPAPPTLVESAVTRSGEETATPPLNPARTWVAVGAGAFGSLVIVGFVIAMVYSRPQPKPPIAATPTVTPVPPKSPPVVSTTGNDRSPPDLPPVPPPPPQPPAPPRGPSPAARATGLAGSITPGPVPGNRPGRGTNRPDRSTGGFSRTNDPPESPPGDELATKAEASLAREESTTSGNLAGRSLAREAPPPPSLFRNLSFSPALLKRPKAVRATVEKIVADPRPFFEQVIVPAGMYHLAPSRSDRPDGPRKCQVTEQRIELGKMNPRHSNELELDPRLAEQLDRLDSGEREGQPTILTLWVTKTGDCGLVRVAILQKANPRLKRGYSQKPDIRYDAIEVTSEGSRPVESPDEDWEQVERFLSLAMSYKRSVRAQQLMWKNYQEAQIQNQMNSVWKSTLSDVFRGEQSRMMRERMVGGR